MRNRGRAYKIDQKIRIKAKAQKIVKYRWVGKHTEDSQKKYIAAWANKHADNLKCARCSCCSNIRRQTDRTLWDRLTKAEKLSILDLRDAGFQTEDNVCQEYLDREIFGMVNFYEDLDIPDPYDDYLEWIDNE